MQGERNSTLPSTFELHVDDQAGTVLGNDRSTHCSFVRGEFLVRDDALGELDEVVIDGPVRNPGARIPEHSTAAAADRETEGAERDLGGEASLR